MTAPMMTVLKPGLLTTVQDLGRHGWQHLGVPVSGAMDEVSLRLANLLVGNDEDDAALEITLVGPLLRFDHGAVIAVCGAELSAEIVDSEGRTLQPLLLDCATRVPAGASVRFGPRLFGVRAYLAARGGLMVADTMGSASTYVRGGLGGVEGRALRAGDSVAMRGTVASEAAAEGEPRGRSQGHGPRGRVTSDADGEAPCLCAAARRLVRQLAAELDPAPIRAMTGPEWPQFTSESQADFFRLPASVGLQSERMGYRLATTPLRRRQEWSGDLLSEAVTMGTVQVPSDGMPIVLMADRQSTGGYPRIALVATVDLPRLAQVMPGDSIRFEQIDVASAQALLIARERRFEALAQAVRAPADM